MSRWHIIRLFAYATAIHLAFSTIVACAVFFLLHRLAEISSEFVCSVSWVCYLFIYLFFRSLSLSSSGWIFARVYETLRHQTHTCNCIIRGGFGRINSGVWKNWIDYSIDKRLRSEKETTWQINGRSRLGRSTQKSQSIRKSISDNNNNNNKVPVLALVSEWLRACNRAMTIQKWRRRRRKKSLAQVTPSTCKITNG